MFLKSEVFGGAALHAGTRNFPRLPKRLLAVAKASFQEFPVSEASSPHPNKILVKLINPCTPQTLNFPRS